MLLFLFLRNSYVYIYICIHRLSDTFIYIYIYMTIHTFIHIYVYIYVYIYICIYICLPYPMYPGSGSVCYFIYFQVHPAFR